MTTLIIASHLNSPARYHLLQASVRSCLTQSVPFSEIIIHISGTNDHGFYGLGGTRVIYTGAFRMGQMEHIGHALLRTRTPRVMIMDDDDLISPTYHERLLHRRLPCRGWIYKNPFIITLDDTWNPAWDNASNMVIRGTNELPGTLWETTDLIDQVIRVCDIPAAHYGTGDQTLMLTEDIQSRITLIYGAYYLYRVWRSNYGEIAEWARHVRVATKEEAQSSMELSKQLNVHRIRNVSEFRSKPSFEYSNVPLPLEER